MLLSRNPAICTYPCCGKDNIVYLPYAPGGGQPAFLIALSDPVIVQVWSLEGGDAIVHLLNSFEQAQRRQYS